jgi:hypothetical protein
MIISRHIGISDRYVWQHCGGGIRLIDKSGIILWDGVLIDTYSLGCVGAEYIVNKHEVRTKISSISRVHRVQISIEWLLDLPGAALANNAQCRGSIHCQCVWLFYDSLSVSSPSACDCNMTNQNVFVQQTLLVQRQAFLINMQRSHQTLITSGKSRLKAQTWPILTRVHFARQADRDADDSCSTSTKAKACTWINSSGSSC